MEKNFKLTIAIALAALLRFVVYVTIPFRPRFLLLQFRVGFLVCLVLCLGASVSRRGARRCITLPCTILLVDLQIQEIS